MSRRFEAPASPCVEAWASTRRGGREMRPRFGSAIADRAAGATADPSRWTHRVGMIGRARCKFTPTRNAIGLSSLVGAELTVAFGELSPWRSVLLYLSRAVRGVYVAGSAKWSVAQRSVPCRATARCSVNSRTEPIRREQPIVLCDPITRGGRVGRWVGRDRCPVGSPRRKCDPHSERQYRDRRGSRWLAVSNGEPT